MSADPREELISAYLDGEVSDDERAQVEQWLSESSQLRRLHAELRAMRDGMQSLERHKLDHDISAAVLRRAEQTVLRGEDHRPVAGSIRPAPQPAGSDGRGSWRRFAWPAAAVAAAVLLLVYDASRRTPEVEVARAPEQDDFAAAPADDLAAQAVELRQQQEAAPAPAQRAAGEATPELRIEAARQADADGDGYRSPASALQDRAANPTQSDAMLEGLSRQAQPANQPEAIMRSRGRTESLDPSVGRIKKEDGLVLECTSEFFRDRAFEKLLDEQKIEWRRVDDDRRKALAKSDEPLSSVKASTLEAAAFSAGESASYEVDATREQLDRVLGKLGPNQLRRMPSLASLAYSQSREFRALPRDESAGRGGNKASTFKITLVAPPPAAKPAEAPAEKSP